MQGHQITGAQPLAPLSTRMQKQQPTGLRVVLPGYTLHMTLLTAILTTKSYKNQPVHMLWEWS